MGLELLQREHRRPRGVGRVALAIPVALLLTSCSADDRAEWGRLAMPVGASNQSQGIQDLWVGAWIAALVTGVVVWGLIFYVAIRYRRRSDDEIPVQTRYNLPMEILYTIAPVVMVLVFFKFTVDTQNDVREIDENPDHRVVVVGQQWSWTFNYLGEDAVGGTDVYQPGTTADPPTLTLPVGESVTFELVSPDVIHSFWVPAFTYKLDVVPGRTNAFSMTPTREGSYEGRCAELCGVYHSRMLFNVEVVDRAEFDAYLEGLERQGFTGQALGGEDADTQTGLEEQVQDDDTQGGLE